MSRGYVTRGRAEELEQLLAASEARMSARITALEREVERSRQLPLELGQAIVRGILTVLTRSSAAAGLSTVEPSPRARKREEVRG